MPGAFIARLIHTHPAIRPRPSIYFTPNSTEIRFEAFESLESIHMNMHRFAKYLALYIYSGYDCAKATKRCVIHFPHAKHVARKSRWVGTSGETSGLPLVGRRLNLSEPESIPVMIPVPRSTRHLPGETYPLDI